MSRQSVAKLLCKVSNCNTSYLIVNKSNIYIFTFVREMLLHIVATDFASIHGVLDSRVE